MLFTAWIEQWYICFFIRSNVLAVDEIEEYIKTFVFGNEVKFAGGN